MRIIFVRHGESEENAGLNDNHDSELTKKGKEQARQLGMALKKQGISKIYTSKMIRARQTGEIISKIINVPVKENLEEFNEYKSRMLKSRLKILFHKRLKKLKKLLDEISRERKEDKTILIVAHGMTNRLIMGYLLGIPLKKQLIRFRQHNTCINILVWKEEYKNWNLMCMNDISHLPAKLISSSIS